MNLFENLPPFYVGQKVVCINPHPHHPIKHGDVFTVESIQKKCCDWLITIGVPANTLNQYCTCCEARYKNDGWGLYSAQRFAPLEQIKFPKLQLTKIIEKELELTSLN